MKPSTVTTDKPLPKPPTECCSWTCHNIAEFYVAWPGQPTKMCGPCLERAKRVAETMGFSLPWSRINAVEENQ